MFTPLQYIILALIGLLILVLFIFLIINQFSIMADLKAVKEALVALQTSVDDNQQKVIAKIQELKNQIAAGTGVTEADLDDLLSTVQNIKTDVDTTDEGLGA